MARPTAPVLIPATAGFYLATLDADGVITRWPIVGWRIPADGKIGTEHVVPLGLAEITPEHKATILAPGGLTYDFATGTMSEGQPWPNERPMIEPQPVKSLIPEPVKAALATPKPTPRATPKPSALAAAGETLVGGEPQIRTNPEDRYDPATAEIVVDPREHLMAGPGLPGEGTTLPGQDNPSVHANGPVEVDLGSLAHNPNRFEDGDALDDDAAGLI